MRRVCGISTATGTHKLKRTGKWTAPGCGALRRPPPGPRRSAETCPLSSTLRSQPLSGAFGSSPPHSTLQTWLQTWLQNGPAVRQRPSPRPRPPRTCSSQCSTGACPPGRLSPTEIDRRRGCQLIFIAFAGSDGDGVITKAELEAGLAGTPHSVQRNRERLVMAPYQRVPAETGELEAALRLDASLSRTVVRAQQMRSFCHVADPAGLRGDVYFSRGGSWGCRADWGRSRTGRG